MAAKIVRQPNKIALIGAPTSAAALAPGHERAPAVLRAGGLIARLESAGYKVSDLGDCPAQVYQPDDEHPRARNLGPILACLNALRPMVELAVKSGALPLILGGDCTIALATVAAVRRYYSPVSLIYCDSDADLNTPATTPSGCVDGMVISHLIGRGAPELVRFWSEPPLVREPDIALFGVGRLDPPEERFLARSPIRRYPVAEIQRQVTARTAEAALQRVHSSNKHLVLHLDVDTIAAEDFNATNFPGPGGLRLGEVRQALEIFAREPNLAAFEITVYNPERDPDGRQAQVVIDLIVSTLAARLAALGPSAARATPAQAEVATAPAPTSADEVSTPPATAAPESSPAEAEANAKAEANTESPSV